MDVGFFSEGQERTLFGVLFLCQLRNLSFQFRYAFGLGGLVLAWRNVRNLTKAE